MRWQLLLEQESYVTIFLFLAFGAITTMTVMVAKKALAGEFMKMAGAAAV